MRRLLILIISAPLLLALLITGYIWYSGKKQVDAAIQQLAPFANVKYSQLWVSPSGAISLEGIRITPHGSYNDFTIARLELKAPDLWDLFNLKEKLRRGQLVESLALAAERITVPIYALPLPLSSTDESFALEPQPAAVSFGALGCGAISAFAINDYVAMGYENLITDYYLSYRYDEESGRLTLKSTSLLHDSASIDTELELTTSTQDDGGIGTTKLVRGRLSYTDFSFNQRRNTFCAEQASLTVPQYIDEHTRLARLFFEQNGMIPSAGLIAAYREFISIDGEARLDIKFSPDTALGLSELAQKSLQQWLQSLQPQIAVNGKAMDDISLSVNNEFLSDFGLPDLSNALVFLSDATITTTTTPDQSESESVNKLLKIINPPVSNGSFRTIRSNEVSVHLGKPTVIKTAKGKRIQGKLVDADRSALQIEIYMLGGSIGYWLDYNEIDNIQVYY